MFFVIFLVSVAAGIGGAILGLGGGIIIVPALTLLLNLPIRFAIGASIVAVIAGSSGAAAAYIRDRMTNLRIGLALEVMTTTGALTGALVAGYVSPHWLYLIFGLLLGYSAIALLGRLKLELPGQVPYDPLAERLRFSGDYYDQALGQRVNYTATGVIPGAVMMYLAGIFSGLLGIGSGLFKVMAMDVAMRLPMKVSTSTSNFMVGVTAAASASVYFSRGDIPAPIAAPVALGVLGGAWFGTNLMGHLRNTTIRKLFIPVLVVVAVSMIAKAIRSP
ncbi:MAG: sulfite exporter TauE/SafE family protein [Bacillati bacterium ANGP1]|uniref:Probable membrane transporter protein n=1 Tax=Candidatus Segetimicrobium genomatis TaxID=2569760 RepID=A0A537J3U9_9BACT|nr:MAG: sulfite exporter TauE/SafE family protein [Terrabacteria group bacterium ANGP1]